LQELLATELAHVKIVEQAESELAEVFLARVVAKTRQFPSLDQDEIVKDRIIHGLLPRYSSHFLASDMEAWRRLPQYALQRKLKRRIRAVDSTIAAAQGRGALSGLSSMPPSPVTSSASSFPGSSTRTRSSASSTGPSLKSGSMLVVTETDAHLPSSLVLQPQVWPEDAFLELCQARAAISHLPPVAYAFVCGAAPPVDAKALIAAKPRRSPFQWQPTFYYGLESGHFATDCSYFTKEQMAFTRQRYEMYL
jgi:hypothetical protein